jgi:hypothetical protein
MKFRFTRRNVRPDLADVAVCQHHRGRGCPIAYGGDVIACFSNDLSQALHIWDKLIADRRATASDTAYSGAWPVQLESRSADRPSNRREPWRVAIDRADGHQTIRTCREPTRPRYSVPAIRFALSPSLDPVMSSAVDSRQSSWFAHDGAGPRTMGISNRAGRF